MIVLIDIDGTLIDTGGAGRRAMTQAFFEIIGRRDVGDFSFAGLTDRAIVRRALSAARASADAPHIDRVMDRYLSLLPGALAHADYRVLPGVAALVIRLAEADRVALGLGTGNVRAGARIKLGPGDLMRYFAFGGFGCDAEDRAELLRVGVERGARALGAVSEACARWVIGDTPLDVRAALAIGARCLGVATGIFSREELLGAGATLAVSDLGDPRVLEALHL